MQDDAHSRWPRCVDAIALPAAAQSLTKVNVVLNFAADGGSTGFYHALERGYFREAGLDVTIEPSKGSADAITRTASQASDIGVGDISTLTEFASRRPEIAPKAVFILHNRTPSAVISLKSSGITKLTDLYGRVLGQGPADAPSRMFAAVAGLNSLDMSRITIKQFSPQLRDTMLVTKQVDAVTGFDSTTLLVLKANGMAIEDANVMSYGDLGFDVYGNAFLANPAFLAGQSQGRARVRARGVARLARRDGRSEGRHRLADEAQQRSPSPTSRKAGSCGWRRTRS